MYWESKIRIYGLVKQTRLSLSTIVFPIDKLAYWGRQIALLGSTGRGFEMVSLQPLAHSSMQFCLLLAENDQEILPLLEKELIDDDTASLQTVTPVELIYLHGPHFQDRYGIAEAALAPLRRGNIAILATGCSGTSVFLVVHENMAEMAASCLSETFVI